MARAKGITTIEIDKDKLRTLLKVYCKSKETSLKGLSHQLGFSESYFSDVLERGTIRKFVIEWLDRECGIKFDDYKLKTNPEKTDSVPNTSNDLVGVIKSLDNIGKLLTEINKKLDNIQSINELQTETLDKIKDNTQRKPYATVKGV